MPAERPRRLRRWLWRLTLLAVLLGIGLVGAVVVYVATVAIPADRLQLQTTFVYAANGERLAALNNGENREAVRLADVPKVAIDAVLAAEDRRFYEHGGVDPIGVARALFQDLRHSGRRQGGSTITQQYVKNVYVGREASVRRKIREAAIAVKLERKLSKDQILERYLNTIYFGRGAYGIQAAARAQFGIDMAHVDLAQAAYLAALIRGPESTDAKKDEAKARSRRSSVLTAMVQTGAISEAQRAAADATPFTGPHGVVERRSVGTVYDHPEAGAEYFVDAVRRALIERYGEDVVTGRGLRVTTTLDLAAQTRAYKAAFTTTLNRPTDPDAAVVMLDHAGHVKAMVGGRSWATSKVNLAMGRDGGGVGRAGGSTFKPFVLATAVREGYTVESAFAAPASIAIDGADVGGSAWKVRNYDDTSYGTVNLIDATRESINTVYAQLVTNAAIGPARIVQTATDLGIESPLNPVSAIALGTEDVSPLEMANAYLTLANRGIRTQPTFVSSVVDAAGKRLSVPTPGHERAVPKATADVVNAVLQRVVRDGTGVGARVRGVAIAGKTGTTNDYNDAWFIGYTPKECCAVAVWMGYPDGKKQMTSVHGRKVSGGSFPAQVFALTLGPTVKGVDVGTFEPVTAYPGKLLGDSRRRAGTGSGSGSGSAAKPTRVPVPSGTEAPASPVSVSGPPVSAVEGGSSDAPVSVSEAPAAPPRSSPAAGAPAPAPVQPEVAPTVAAVQPSGPPQTGVSSG